MQILRGPSGGKTTWKPFRFNPKIANRNARLHRLKRKGLTPPTDKASLRAAADLAAAQRQP
jgi:hypothetical protein